MIKIKGSHVKFEMRDGEIISLPPSYGIIHDPEGADLPRCAVYFGPYAAGRKPAKLDSSGQAYFGDQYAAVEATVDLPEGTWDSIGEVAQIFYRRPAGKRIAKYTGKYHHPFKKIAAPTLLRHQGRRFYKFDMTSFCIIDDRGFVFP